jgi:hypothetical protein
VFRATRYRIKIAYLEDGGGTHAFINYFLDYFTSMKSACESENSAGPGARNRRIRKSERYISEEIFGTSVTYFY